MYLQMKELKKFTSKAEVDILVGEPKFQIGKRLVYYYGNGILVSYTSKCFKVENNNRIEYGNEGKYAVKIYHFSDVEMLKLYFDLEDFEEQNIFSTDSVTVNEQITYETSFQEIHDMIGNGLLDDICQGGENYRLVDGKMKIVYLSVMYGNYTLFFRGKSKKGKLSGFSWTLKE